MTKLVQSWLAKILGMTLALGAVCCASACKSDKGAQENVEITLSRTEVELFEGESLRLTVAISPADTMDKSVMWRSTDTSVADVEEGVVTAKKPGEATVTVQTGEKTATCKVTVKEPGKTE